MTRIAAGPVPSNQTGIDETPARLGANSVEAGTAAGAQAPRPGGLPADVGPDRPLPQSPASARPTTIDTRALRDDLVRWEGNKPFMYLCRAGFVTTGIGNKLSNAAEAIALPWQHKATGLPATPAEIRAAFSRVSAMTSEFRNIDPKAGNPYHANHYEKVSDLVLPQDLAKELAVERLTKDFLPGLRRLFPDFNSYPLPAQRALVDMAYSMGVKGLEVKFPKLVGACRNQDFSRAAVESKRPAAQAERNAATYRLFAEAEHLKTSVQTFAREVRP